MTSIPKHVFNDKLDDIIYKYNNTYPKTIQTKSSTHIDFEVESIN